MLARASGAALTSHWSCYDRNAMAVEMGDRFLDRPGPHEAQVAVSRFDRLLGVQSGKTRTMDIELPVTEAIVTKPFILLIDLSAEHIAIERIRALPA